MQFLLLRTAMVARNKEFERRVISTNFEPNGFHTVTTNRHGLIRSTTRFNSAGTVILQTTYGYDAHNRQSQVTDLLTGTTSYTYNNADQVVTMTTPVPATGQSAQTTTRYYDDMGRNWRTVMPDGSSVTNEYHATGLLKKTYGSRTYPVGYGYDSQGRMRYMTNWSDFDSSTGARVTEWQYDQERGFLTNKLYSGEQGPSYSYTDAGRLLTRSWARLHGGNRITTTYTTNAAGDVASIVYSDGTTGLTNSYDRRGRLSTVLQGDMLTTRTYSELNLLLTEKYSGGLLNGLGLTNRYDSTHLLRTNFFSVMGNVFFDYATSLRMSAVRRGSAQFNYDYVAYAPSLVKTIYATNSSVRRLVSNRSYDNLVRLTNINTEISGSVGSQFKYTYNDANQRTVRTDLDGSYWVYQYDELGQVTSGKRYWSDGTPVSGQQYEYGFDDIGNRKHTMTGGNEFGTGLRYSGYTANNLNQITSRTVPPYVNVLGTATNNATVTVNNQPTYRKGEYWHRELSVDNGSALWLGVTNIAVQPNGANPDKVTNIVGNIFVPPATETITHDADGNTTQDGRWEMSWDAENRLTNIVSLTSTPLASRRKVTYAYDYQGRLLRRTAYNGSSGSYVLTEDLKYIYDGWRCMAEINVTGGDTVRSYVWGLDISGTMDGAGGVGGLLGVFLHSNSAFHFPFYDGNGNVVGLVNGNNGNVSANYEYDAFGKVIRQTGGLATLNRFRFSTKYTDDETDLVYYGYRFYNPSTGRWLSRDPIEEWGGFNLYGFIGNDLVNRVDLFGLGPPAAPPPTTWGGPYLNSPTALGGAAGGITIGGGSTATVGAGVVTISITGSAAVGVGAGYLINNYVPVAGTTFLEYNVQAWVDLLQPLYGPAPVPRPPPQPQPQPNPVSPPVAPETETPEERRKCHRGRIQAQGNGVNKSARWAQNHPLTILEGRLKYAELLAKLTPYEKWQRTSGLIAANRWMSYAAATGGTAKGKSFLEVLYTKRPSEIDDPRHTRVDIEVNSGLAFVP